jgi:hypothetical protein
MLELKGATRGLRAGEWAEGDCGLEVLPAVLVVISEASCGLLTMSAALLARQLSDTMGRDA